MTQQAPSIIKPALIAGAIFGFISAIPCLGEVLNCVCCSLIIGSGVLAAKFQSNACRSADVEFAGSGGAKVGALAGVFYAVVSSILGSIVGLAMGGAARMDQLVDQLSSNSDFEVPPELLEFLSSGALTGGSGFFITLIVGLVFGLIFATLGGLIGGSIFKVELPAGSTFAPPPPPEAGV